VDRRPSNERLLQVPPSDGDGLCSKAPSFLLGLAKLALYTHATPPSLSPSSLPHLHLLLVSVADSQVLLAATRSPKPVKPPRTCAIKSRLPRHPPAARTFTRRRLCFAAARSSTREVLRSRLASSVWLRELPDLVSDVQRLVPSRPPLHARGASRLCFWLVL
jgi:hypothetical protein